MHTEAHSRRRRAYTTIRIITLISEVVATNLRSWLQIPGRRGLVLVFHTFGSVASILTTALRIVSRTQCYNHTMAGIYQVS